MNILNRLRKLEQNYSPKTIEDGPNKEDQPEICEHPPSMFHFYRSYFKIRLMHNNMHASTQNAL